MHFPRVYGMIEANAISAELRRCKSRANEKQCENEFLMIHRFSS